MSMDGDKRPQRVALYRSEFLCNDFGMQICQTMFKFERMTEPTRTSPRWIWQKMITTRSRLQLVYLQSW